jgi:transcriptional regulator with XRE-family HTH domain
MPEDFGGRLRQRREEQGVSLAAIAERTKIKISVLEALERNDVAQLPHGIFRRAYIRSYAEAVGLNGDVVVHEFLALYPDRPDMLPEEPVAVSADDNRPGAPPTRFRYLMDSAMGSLGRRRPVTRTEHIATPSSVGQLVPSESPAVVSGAKASDSIGLTDIRAEEPVAPAPNWEAFGALCTRFGQVETVEDLQPLLLEAVRMLQASGLIVWSWTESSEELRPVLAAGYPDKVLVQLPALPRDADNITAEAFRFTRITSLPGDSQATAALAVPIVSAGRTSGVLALEIPCAGDPAASVRSAAAILSALLALLI